MTDIKKEVDNSLFVINEYGVKHQDPAGRVSQEVIDYYADRYGIMTDVHNTCISCQIRQIEKYNQDFEIKCTGIAKKLPEGSGAKLKAITESNPEIDQAQALKIIKESNGTAQIDPLDADLWKWARRVAENKFTESVKIDVYAATTYERMGGTWGIAQINE